MRNISDTITRFAAIRGRSVGGLTADRPGTLTRFDDFGTNPGALDAWHYIPENAPAGMPLVVVLHGCTQNGRDYDRDSGWSQVAVEFGFALLVPEQRRANNFNLCFNWYETSDNRRGVGEAASIKQMIDCMAERYDIDRDRVFVNGLSAGGAMTSVMLAAYPETFAAGAIIAGLPYGAANSVAEAFDRMRGHGGPDGPALAQLVRAASPSNGSWPAVSVWHGDADTVVSASNADDIVEQWRALHGVDSLASASDEVDGYPHRVWHDAQGRAVVQDYRITGMGHGTPLATTGDDACGSSGAHMLEVGISSTRRIAFDWGLGQAEPRRRTPSEVETRSRTNPRPKARKLASEGQPDIMSASGITKTIEDALRTAGLMK